MIEKLEMSEQFKDEVMVLRRAPADSFQDIVQRALSFYKAARDAESKGCKIIFKSNKKSFEIVVP